ncbi:UNVERIFIED_CONTAM: hypothetical protein RMT77_016594 [Armadillidium vulgare]
MDFETLFQRCQDLGIEGKEAKELVEKEREALERQKQREERQKQRDLEYRLLKIQLGLVSEFDDSIEELHNESSKLAERERNFEEKKKLKFELADPKQEKAVLPSISGSELSRQIISSWESPMKGENFSSQRELFAEREASAFRDSSSLPYQEVIEVTSSFDTAAISTTYITTAATSEECSLVPASMLVNSHDVAFIEKMNDLEEMDSELIKNNEIKKQKVPVLKMENDKLKETTSVRLEQSTPPLVIQKMEFLTKAITDNMEKIDTIVSSDEQDLENNPVEAEENKVVIKSCRKLNVQVKLEEERTLEEERGCSVEITISSGKESQIEKPITSSQVLPMKGENCFSQPQSSAEREEPSSQDLPILSASPKWERNEDEISSLSKAFAEQDEREENFVICNVLSRSDNVLSSKWLSNQCMTSCKSYMERNKEREVEYDVTPTLELEKVNSQETEKRDSSFHITISSEKESQIGQPRMGMTESESESEVKCNMSDRKSTIEEKEEGHEHDLTVIKSRDYSLRNKKRTIKKPYLNCEKEFQSYSSPSSFSSNPASSHSSSDEENVIKRKKRRKGRRHIRKKQEDADYNDDEKSEKPIVTVYVKNVVDELYCEKDSIESSNVIVVLESAYEGEDPKVESNSHLSFSSSFPSSTHFSSSFSNSVEENKIKGKKKMKKIHRKRKRKGHNDNNEDERCDSNCMCDIGTTCKKLMIRIRRIRLYKYRRKGKVMTR